MKTMSEFMDKQIMELSRSHSDDFSQLLYTPENDDVFDSSFHLRPQRHVVSQQSRISTLQDYGAGSSEESALVSVIGKKMDQHFDNLMHAVEGLSARLTQLETRLRLMENSIDDLKDSSEINHGRTDGKLRQLENILREVEGGMQDLRDKQDISEAQLQLAKFQMIKDRQQFENQISNVQTTSAEGVSSSTPQQTQQPHSSPDASIPLPSFHVNVPPTTPHQYFPPAPTTSAERVSSSTPQQSQQPHSSPLASIPLPSFPVNVPRTIPHQYFPPAPAAQLPNQSPQNQVHSLQQTDSNYSPPVLNPLPAHQMYYMPHVEQSQPPPTAPYQPYPPASHPLPTSQVQQLPQFHQSLHSVDPQSQCSLVPNFGEPHYMVSQSYPPSIQKTSNVPGLAPPTQQQYTGSVQYTHDQSTSNHPPEYPPGHFQPAQHSTFDELYSHSGSSFHNSGSKMKDSQISPPSLVRSDGSSFTRGLPTAKVLPYALPMVSSVEESSSGSTGNRIPIDNVIDKVVAMGFRRDVVRATVKKMTENGQSVDLNVVLDKLMNSGEVQSQSGAFGR